MVFIGRKNIYEKIKFILAIVLTLCIVTGSRRNISAFAVSADNISPEIMFEIQRDACLANETLYASFEQNGTYIYPEDFAGTYIDYDTLCVLVTEGGDIDRYNSVLSDFDCVKYQSAEYSYNELFSEVQRAAEEELSETGVIGYGVDVLENKGFISVLKSSYNKFLRSYNADDMVPDNGSMRIHNMTKAEIITGTTGPGDSGGPYRCGTDFCGIHHGAATQGGTATYVYFTPYTYIYNAGFRIETGEQLYGM